MIRLNVFLLAICMLVAAPTTSVCDCGWSFPPNNGYFDLYLPAFEPDVCYHGNIHIDAHYMGYCEYESDVAPGSIKLGNAVFPSIPIYFASWPSPYRITHYTDCVQIGFMPGDTSIALQSVGDARAWCGTSFGVQMPRFGLPQITQVGNNNPYADGSTTFAQNGCYLCTLLGWYQFFYGDTSITLEILNDRMNQAGGYGGENGRDIITPIACRILRMIYIGSFAYNDENVQKYAAREWGKCVHVKYWNNNKKSWRHHFVANCPGVKMTNENVEYSMMDPALRFSWFNGSFYRPVNMRVVAPYSDCTRNGIPYEMTQYGWWNNPFAHIGYCSSLTSYAVPDSNIATLITEQALVWFRSNTGILIDKVECPEFTLTPDSSMERATLINDFNLEHDDLIEPDDPQNADPEPPNNCSEATIGFPKTGNYTVYLSGNPGAVYKITAFFGYSDETWEKRIFEGSIGQDGKTMFSVNYDPITIVLQLGALKSLNVGSNVVLSYIQVTNIKGNELFCQNNERICGIRVTTDGSVALPQIHDEIMVEGMLTQKTDEIAINAKKITSSGQVYEPAKPLGFGNTWPAMANCLLARIAGKVESITANTANIRIGDGIIEASNIPEGLSSGDFIIFDSILRADKKVNIISDTCQIVN